MISILLPTLGERLSELKRLFDSLEEQTNKQFELIIVTQGNHQEVEILLSNYNFKNQQVKTDKRGLSRARNIGINYCKGNLVLLSDDDAWYPNFVIDYLEQQFYGESIDIGCFKIFDPLINSDYKDYSRHNQYLTKIDLLRKSSIELCFSLKNIRKKELLFNEQFGLGSEFPSGEENILLCELYKKGYNFKFFDKTIVYHQKKKSIEFNETLLYTKGAIFTEIFGKLKGIILLNYFILRHIKNINQNKLKHILNANRKLLFYNVQK